MKSSFISKSPVMGGAGWKHSIRRLRGSTVCFDLRRYALPAAAIAELERACRDLSDEELSRGSRALRDRARAGESLLALRDSFFALVREASRRVLGQRPFDEQVLAALALDAGHVVEM